MGGKDLGLIEGSLGMHALSVSGVSARADSRP